MRFETFASVLYSNVLTLDLTRYRDEAGDVVEAIRQSLPGYIDDIRHLKAKVDRVQTFKDGELIEMSSAVSEVRARLKAIESKLTFGLERGGSWRFFSGSGGVRNKQFSLRTSTRKMRLHVSTFQRQFEWQLLI